MLRKTYYQGGMGKVAFNYYTLEYKGSGNIVVYGWGTYGRSSVLAGQSQKTFLDSFSSEQAAVAALVEADIDPEEVQWSNQYLEPQNSFNHLEGNDL